MTNYMIYASLEVQRPLKELFFYFINNSSQDYDFDGLKDFQGNISVSTPAVNIFRILSIRSEVLRHAGHTSTKMAPRHGMRKEWPTYVKQLTLNSQSWSFESWYPGFSS